MDLQNNINDVIETYSDSLSLLCAIIYVFNINIKNQNEILLNDKCQIYLSRLNHNLHGQIQNGNFSLNNLLDILGSKNSIFYKKFINKTIEYYNYLKKFDFDLYNNLCEQNILTNDFYENLTEEAIIELLK